MNLGKCGDLDGCGKSSGQRYDYFWELEGYGFLSKGGMGNGSCYAGRGDDPGLKSKDGSGRPMGYGHVLPEGDDRGVRLPGSSNYDATGRG